MIIIINTFSTHFSLSPFVKLKYEIEICLWLCKSDVTVIILKTWLVNNVILVTFIKMFSAIHLFAKQISGMRL